MTRTNTEPTPKRITALTTISDIGGLAYLPSQKAAWMTPAAVALGKGSALEAGQFLQMAFSALKNDPMGKIAECTLESVCRSILQCAELGVRPGSALGHVYFIPSHNNKSRCLELGIIISAFGYIEICRRSEQIVDVWSEVVYEADEFHEVAGTERRIDHTPARHLEEDVPKSKGGRGSVIFAYAVAKLKNGTTSFQIVSRRDLDRARAASKAPDSPAWKKWPAEMQRKTTLKRLCKYLPQTEASARVIDFEENNAAPAGMPVPPPARSANPLELVAKADGNGGDWPTVDTSGAPVHHNDPVAEPDPAPEEPRERQPGEEG